MGHNGNFAAPEYATESGVVFHLRPINALFVQRWAVDYEKRYPTPLPPKKVLENGEEWYDTADIAYKQQLEIYELAKNSAFLEFLFKMGIRDNPPEDWQPELAYDFGMEPKIQWIFELLPNDDLQPLSEAIQGLSIPTEQAVEDAEKNSPSPSEESLPPATP